jgi:hypothetical protein
MKQCVVLWSCVVRAQKSVNITQEAFQFVLVNTQYIVVWIGWHGGLINVERIDSFRRGSLIRP